MGEQTGRILNDEERKFTEKTVAEQEWQFGVLKLKERRIQIEIDEMPYKQKMFKQQLEQCRFELNTLKQAIVNGNVSLKNGVIKKSGV